MKKWLSNNYKTLIVLAFLIPIIIVAIVSISHVTVWYGVSNPISWAIYLSVGIEIAALSSLAALTADMGKKIWVPFIIVTFIQFIGNIFFAYEFIDTASQMFQSWVELVSPLFEFIGVRGTDLIAHKRVLALLAGGLLPVISLSFLHMLIRFTEKKDDNLNEEEKPEEIPPENPDDLKIKVDEDTLNKVEDGLFSKKPKTRDEVIQDIRKETGKSILQQISDEVNEELNNEESQDEVLKEIIETASDNVLSNEDLTDIEYLKKNLNEGLQQPPQNEELEQETNTIEEPTTNEQLGVQDNSMSEPNNTEELEDEQKRVEYDLDLPATSGNEEGVKKKHN